MTWHFGFAVLGTPLIQIELGHRDDTDDTDTGSARTADTVIEIDEPEMGYRAND